MLSSLASTGGSQLEAEKWAMDDALYQLFYDLDQNEDGKILGKKEIYHIFDSLR